MFGCNDASQILCAIAECCRAYPQSYVRLTAHDSLKHTSVISFMVQSPGDRSNGWEMAPVTGEEKIGCAPYVSGNAAADCQGAHGVTVANLCAKKEICEVFPSLVPESASFLPSPQSRLCVTPESNCQFGVHSNVSLEDLKDREQIGSDCSDSESSSFSTETCHTQESFTQCTQSPFGDPKVARTTPTSFLCFHMKSR